jgi:predicted protein tyrosine phosphatase
MLTKQIEKKSLRGTYLVGYLNEVLVGHFIINLDSDKEFEKVQQHLISIVELKIGNHLRLLHE